MRPSVCLEYTADDGFVIYGLKEQIWEQMEIMDELMDVADSGRGEILSIQVIEGFQPRITEKDLNYNLRSLMSYVINLV
jgi:hypothetical protein